MLCIDIARVENSLVKVLSCAQVIIVKGQNGNIARKFNNPFSKIQAYDKQQENHNDENSDAIRVTREKVDAHRDPFLTQEADDL